MMFNDDYERVCQVAAKQRSRRLLWVTLRLAPCSWSTSWSLPTTLSLTPRSDGMLGGVKRGKGTPGGYALHLRSANRGPATSQPSGIAILPGPPMKNIKIRPSIVGKLSDDQTL